MTQLLLDDIDRNTLLRQFGSVGVSQSVGVDSFLNPGFTSQPWQVTI